MGIFIDEIGVCMEEINVTNQKSLKDTSSERNWAMIGHLGGLIPGYFLCLIVPLVVWLIKGDSSEFIYKQSREALNFQISLVIYESFSLLLIFTIIGIPIMILSFIVFWVVNVICSLKGAIRVSRGQEFRYPMNLRLIN